MKFFRKFIIIRALFILFAIGVQLSLFVGAVLRFNDYFAFFYGSSLLICIVQILLIINNKSNPSYKIAWIIPIMMFPILGGFFYFFFGGKRLSRRIKNRMKYIEDKTKEFLSHDNEVLNEIGACDRNAFNQSKYIQDYAFYPPHNNTFNEYEPIGEINFDSLVRELQKAERFIFLEYFIIQEGVMWNSILDILKEKVKSGVDVRVIYDDAGCFFTLPYRYDKTLESMGIKCCIFNPLIPVLSLRFNNRDHRKIAIVDGITAYTGGINLADEYINKIKKHGHWKDSAILIKGEAVWNLTVMFLSTWNYLRGIDEDFNNFRCHASPKDKEPSKGFIQPFADSPLDDEAVGEIVYFNIINKAKNYVYITTPYLIIGNEMVTALEAAAKGGVDIRIITPHLADKWYVHSVTRSYYKSLIESGVKIYEYLPGFIHSKTYVSDDEYGVVGTINMDFRSLYLHFECGVWLYGCRSLKDIKNDFLDTLLMCREVTLEEVNSIKWYRSLTRSILRVFAPLM